MRYFDSILRGLICLLLTAWLAGCSSVQLGYGQSERLMKWYVKSYVDLDGPQNRALTQELADLKSWHCSTQLNDYSAFLRQVRSEFGPGVSVEQVRERTEDVQRFIRTIANDAAPRMARLISSMSDAQIAELKRSLAKDNVKYRERWVDVSADKYREERADRMRKRLRYWIGALNPEQNTLVNHWTQTVDVNNAPAFESRLRWQQAMLTAIERRGDGQAFEDDARALMTAPDQFWTEEMQAKLAINRERTYALIRDVANTITTSQKQHVDRKLQSLANDFDQLACTERRAAVQP